MTVAALVTSIIAAILSAACAWYTRRQAGEASLVRKIEAERRHEEMTPDLVGEYVKQGDTHSGERPGVRITNNGPLDLDRIDTSLIPAHRLHERTVEGFFDPRSHYPMGNHETGRLHLGESWTYEIIRSKKDDGYERGGPAKFRCRCYATGHEPWDVLVTVEIPRPTRIHAASPR